MYLCFTGGSGGRRENSIWQAKLFLLPGPDNGFLPPTIELEELAKHGLGKHEIEADKNCVIYFYTLLSNLLAKKAME